MSEKLYALLLRLYPPAFRKAYGNEAMQLVRDRLCQERGFVPRLRLWLDLLSDFAKSLPREYRSVEPVLADPATSHTLKDAPAFQLLEEQRLGAGTLLAALVCFLVVLSAWSILMKQAINHRPFSDASMHGAKAAPTRWTASPAAAGQSSRDAAGAGAPIVQSPSDRLTAPLKAAPLPKATTDVQVNRAERQRVIHAAVVNLKQYYFDREGAVVIANALLNHEEKGDNNAIADGPALAATLTRQMRDAGQNVDLTMEYSRARLPDTPPTQTPADVARSRQFLEENGCFFKNVAMLPHAIGYLRLDGFGDVSVCRPAAKKAMASLNGARALIVDLRNNRGGDPAMVLLMAAYFFDRPQYWYNPRGDAAANSRTQSPVPGNRLANKPVYLLTSPFTWSAAEQLTYDLKMLKRATLVGETTGGGAHAGVWRRIDDHYGMGIPEVRVVNPYEQHDWEGNGVKPDVQVRAADALNAAEDLARRKSSSGHTE